MSVSYCAYLVAGISLQEYFKKVGEKQETFDEHDIYGKKTGRKFNNTSLIATLPSGDDVVIAKKGHNEKYFHYDFYSSLSFEGTESDQTFLKLLYHDYETTDLNCRIIGKIISDTPDVAKIDIDTLNKTILEVRDELKDKFDYNGVVKLYLINFVSY